MPQRVNALHGDLGANRAQLFRLGGVEKPVVQLSGGDAVLGHLKLSYSWPLTQSLAVEGK